MSYQVLSEAEEELEALEVELLLTAVARRYGYDFKDYVPSCIRRRVRQAVWKEGVSSPSALQERVLRDPAALERLISCLSVHITEMFRDPPFYRALRQQVVPLLRTFPFTRIWLAGCATGEEAYSLAILLQEEGLYDRCRIYATDMSAELLKVARRGIYPAESVREWTASYRQAGGLNDFAEWYRAGDGDVVMRESLRRNIVFAQHNLVSDGSFNEFNLILCRNVLIYFEEDLRKRVMRLIHESLRTFGILGLGIGETLSGIPEARHYETLDADLRLYRRVR